MTSTGSQDLGPLSPVEPVINGPSDLLLENSAFGAISFPVLFVLKISSFRNPGLSLLGGFQELVETIGVQPPSFNWKQASFFPVLAQRDLLVGPPCHPHLQNPRLPLGAPLCLNLARTSLLAYIT